jgi:hypothetical protein
MKNIRPTAWIIAGVAAAISLKLFFSTLTADEVLSGPGLFAGWSTRLVLSLITLIFLPLLALVASLVLALITLRDKVYSSRISLIFPIVLAFIEVLVLIKIWSMLK